MSKKFQVRCAHLPNFTNYSHWASCNDLQSCNSLHSVLWSICVAVWFAVAFVSFLCQYSDICIGSSEERVVGCQDICDECLFFEFLVFSFAPSMTWLQEGLTQGWFAIFLIVAKAARKKNISMCERKRFWKFFFKPYKWAIYLETGPSLPDVTWTEVHKQLDRPC